MVSSAGSLALAALALLGNVSAHMTLRTPVPYGNATLDTSPLPNIAIGAEGSKYPCKQREGVYDITQNNEIPVGVPQELTFGGSASHGGGTCQIAVSLDREPTATSVFKLIQVFEGGCPTSGDGNDGSHPFSFTIPKGFPNGDFALAWTWYNKIGNREIYMNCAPITVTGGADNNDLYDSLPNQYIINLPTSECSTVETSDQIIPNPGQYVVKAQANSLSSATGASCAASAAAMTSGVKGYNSIVSNDGAGYSAPAGVGASGATTPASSAAQATSAAGAASSYNNGQYSGLASSSAPAAYTSAIVSSSDPASSPASYPTLSISSGAGVAGPATGTVSAYAPAGTGSTASASDTSSSSGIMCDATHSGQYGVAVNGKTVWRAVAAGTTCEEVAAYRKRSLRHAHVRRHLQNGGHA